MSDQNTDPSLWADNLDQTRIQIWREALAHLRYLSDEVWNGFKTFVYFDAIILAVITVLLFLSPPSAEKMILLAVLSVLGVGLSLIAWHVLKRNRVYYLQMLLKKTLLEDEFGFYQVKFSGSETDLAFPWRLAPETIAELKAKPTEWIARQVCGAGTIARWLFAIRGTITGVYLLLLCFLIYAYFH
jgi:hypothetical protein